MTVSPRLASAVLAGAARIADEVLFPAAAEVEASGRIPPAHLDLLASEGLYAMAGPPELGGLARPSRPGW